jgi:hypothetical protein
LLLFNGTLNLSGLLLLNLNQFFLLLKERFFFFSKIQQFFNVLLIDFVGVFLGFLFNSNSFLGSLRFKSSLLLFNLRLASLFFSIDLLYLNLDLSSEFLSFFSHSFAITSKSSLISNTLLVCVLTCLFSCILLNIKLELHSVNKGSLFGDSLRA